jgi:Protein of unknown function (DUF4038)/Putative collagen-binding domain of a collagenase
MKRKLRSFVVIMGLVGIVALARAESLAESSMHLAVSGNGHYLVEAATGKPFFLLADTAWNLDALTDTEIDRYLTDRAGHGFNAVMFCLDFSPQANAENAYGQVAYTGEGKSELSSEYFAHVDRAVAKVGSLGMYAMVYAMWGGAKAGTMNGYSVEHLHAIGVKLGEHFRGEANVILVAGGESTPPYVDVERVNAIGGGLKEGCGGENLVTVHPCSDRSSSKALAGAKWLDFYMSQVKSGRNGEKADMTPYVAADFLLKEPKPTMVVEHRYEVGTQEDPVIQRRGLYLSVFAGGCGYAYGHNALWQMTPHTAQKWMLSGWNPGVKEWTEALGTVAVGQLAHIKALLYSRPYLERVPDQGVIASAQNKEIADRVEGTRDGTLGKNDATYVMVYRASAKDLTVNTGMIAGKVLKVWWFDPATGMANALKDRLENTGTLVVQAGVAPGDGVVVVDDAAKAYSAPGG